MSDELAAIFERIRARAGAIEALYDSWPCGAGCDHCCRHLYRVPEATRAEWQLFEQGVNALPPAQRDRVRRRIEGLARDQGRLEQGQITCPALDRETGRCLVYAHRPAACRSYGYYRSRAHDLWCHLVETHVADNQPSAPVVWGNQDGLESRLRELYGEAITMTEHFALEVNESHSRDEPGQPTSPGVSRAYPRRA